MKQSLFKRSIAAVTGSVLAVSQALPSLCVVNAAEAVETVDKAWMLNVPIDVTNFGMDTVLPVEAGVSDWNAKVETAALNLGEVNKSIPADKAQSLLRKVLQQIPQLSAELVDAIVEASNLQGTVTGDSYEPYVITLNIDDVSDVVGEELINLIERKGYDMTLEDGRRIDEIVDFDWSSLGLSGTATIELSFGENEYTKTVNYTTTIKDAAGVEITTLTFGSYVDGKADAALSIMKAGIESAITNESGNYPAEIVEEIKAMYLADFADIEDEVKTSVANGNTLLMETLSAISGINVSGADAEQVYADYVAALEDAYENLNTENVPASVLSKIEAIFANAPASLEAALASGKVNTAFSKITDFVNDAELPVEINLSAADLSAILADSYDANYIIDGLSLDAEFSLPDDQAEALTAAYIEAYADVYAEEGLEIIEVVSHKEVTLSATQDSTTYDVVRVIDEIVTEEIEETTTTTGSETTTTTGSETTTTTGSETTTTTSSETTTTTSSETTTTTSSETTTTTSSETTTTTSSETTTTTSSETTTTTSGETTTTTSGETTTTTSSETTTSYSLALDVVAPTSGNYYWSEEETAFDLSAMSATLTVYKDGLVETTLDATAALSLAYNCAAEIAYTGFGSYDVAVNLDNAAVAELLTQNGYAEAAVLAADLVCTASTSVNLVTRGDTNLDESITAQDANDVLCLYISKTVLGKTMEEAVADGYGLYNHNNNLAYLPYLLYAADVDANGVHDATDATFILQYYTHNTVVGRDTAWVEITGAVVHDDILHQDPAAKLNVAE